MIDCDLLCDTDEVVMISLLFHLFRAHNALIFMKTKNRKTAKFYAMLEEETAKLNEDFELEESNLLKVRSKDFSACFRI